LNFFFFFFFFSKGLMLVASVSLSLEGYERDEAHGAWRVVLGNVLGAVFLLTTDHLLHGYDAVLAIGELRGADARKALLVVGIMTVHSFAEGVGIGVSFGGRESDRADLGVLISSTIAAHNAPEVRPIGCFFVLFFHPIGQILLNILIITHSLSCFRVLPLLW
jgi:zinc transporter ZupT